MPAPSRPDGRAINEKVRLYARVGAALIAARDTKQDAFDAITAVIPWDRFRASVAEAEALARSEEFDAYQMLGEHYAGISSAPLPLCARPRMFRTSYSLTSPRSAGSM
jgi:hypothetical protein